MTYWRTIGGSSVRTFGVLLLAAAATVTIIFFLDRKLDELRHPNGTGVVIGAARPRLETAFVIETPVGAYLVRPKRYTALDLDQQCATWYTFEGDRVVTCGTYTVRDTTVEVLGP